MSFIRMQDKFVNAYVILRPNNFDPPVIFLAMLTISKVLSYVCSTQKIDATTPPCGRSSPPGRSVMDGWRRDERTRDIPQSQLGALVSSAKPTTGIQVVRPAVPQCLDSLTPDAHRAGPLHPRPQRFASRPTPAMLRQGDMTPTREPVALTYL